MSNVVPFRPPARPWQCPHCQTWVMPGSVTERGHGATPDRCRKLVARQVREEWRRQDRERLRKAGRPAAAAKRPATPLPPRQPHNATRRRLELLRAALSCPEMHPGLVALTRLSIEALERVAAGKTTLARTQWRRLAVLLGKGVGR